MIVSGDARRLPLADESVQCIVTSPPYWGLRKYAGEQELIWSNPQFLSALDCAHEWADESIENRDIRTGLGLAEWSKANARGGGLKPAKVGSFTVHRGTCARCGAWRGAYGLEPMVDMYVAHTVLILRELRRVLRKDAVLFWNLGDSYHGSWQNYGGGNRGAGKQRLIVKGSTVQNPVWEGLEDWRPPGSFTQPGLKPKDLVLMPARVALAAQADGWWVRSVIVWAKPNPMPESVTDRPTDAYEHILMLTKSARYFWDADAVREPAGDNTHSRGNGDGGPKARDRAEEGTFEGWCDGTREVLASRNLRNVWTFPTQPFSGAHFATFPEELPRRCILAATSAKGACAQCGAPWERVVKKKPATMNIRVRDAKRGVATAEEGYAATEQEIENYGAEMSGETRMIGWSPTCRCPGQHGLTVPCVVLDPFAGSGTTGRVAIELNRRAVLVDLAYARATEVDREKERDYAALARERTTEVQRELPIL
ncbi:MAG: DNA-methyltransferase [Burkholderiales bacterium]